MLHRSKRFFLQQVFAGDGESRPSYWMFFINAGISVSARQLFLSWTLFRGDEFRVELTPLRWYRSLATTLLAMLPFRQYREHHRRKET